MLGRVRSVMLSMFLGSLFASQAALANDPHQGFDCIGAYSTEFACSEAAEQCLVEAQAACIGHGGFSSYSCESCRYYEIPTFAKGKTAKLADDTCPQAGESNGWYMRMWYYCNAE